MSLVELSQKALKDIQNSGIDDVQVTFTKSEVQEFELQGQNINLCRTYFNNSFSAKAVSQNRQARSSVNQWNPEAQEKLTSELKSGLEASPEDKAYSILKSSETQSFRREFREPDLGKLLTRMNEFIAWTKENYPKIHFDSSPIQFVKTEQVLTNTSGLRLEATEDYYEGFVMFTGKDGKRTTSFNYVDFTSYDVPESIQEKSGIESVLALTTRELEEAREVQSPKELVITPYALPDFLDFFLGEISTSSLLTGSSVFKGKRGEKILSDKISLYSKPTSDKYPSFSPYTGDGILSQDGVIFEKGILKNYLIDLYGSLKLDLTPTPFTGSHLSMEAGAQSLSEIIKGVGNGVLLGRFSGGSPSSNGDFSGVAKNSFLIENGKIVAPLKETMISGNLVRLFQQVENVSKDQVFFGSRELPWIHARI